MASSRYASIDSRSSSSSHRSDPSPPSFDSGDRRRPSPRPTSDNSCRALARTRSAVDPAPAKARNGATNFGTMVKKFMEKKSDIKPLVVPTDAIAKKKKAESNISILHRKLFQKGGSADRTAAKTLTELKPNTRTLAMVLRSERELLSQNKEYESEISDLQLLVQVRNQEVERLKDLCLKQREEIKSLKDAILFPDVMNSQLQGLLERQGSELNQAKQIIPNLQKQVTSLTGQIQYLQEDLAEVKAGKHSGMTCFDGSNNSQRTPGHDHEAANSLEYSSGDPFTCEYGSPDDMFLKDLNPCLTPCFKKTVAKDYDNVSGYVPRNGGESLKTGKDFSPDVSSISSVGILSRSSERRERSTTLRGSSSNTPNVCRSDDSKRSASKPTYQNRFWI